MNEDYIRRIDKHDQIIEQLIKSNETLFNITSKLNGEYLKGDKETTEFKIAFQKDIETIKKEISKGNEDTRDVKATLSKVVDGYVRRDEFEARFGRLQEEIDSRLDGANDRISSKTDIDKFDEAYSNIQITLNELKDNQKWVTRLIIGGVVTSLLGLVLIK